MDLVLKVQPRTHTGKDVRVVRAEGFVPGIVYGQGKPATPLQFKDIDLTRLLRSGGASQLIALEGLGKMPVYALMREAQRHPSRRNILHIDFYEVQMDVAVRTEVPLHITGDSAAVRAGAVLIHNLNTLDVECLPRAIPDFITVDISVLETPNDVIHVSDLSIPEGVTLFSDLEEVVVSLALPRILEEDEEEAADELGEEGIEIEAADEDNE
jgi:large subunit ribosomal protein L25